MPDKIFVPNFTGYWRESNKSDLPCISGVYCVHECFYDPFKKKVFLNEIIYIGESDDINEDVSKLSNLTQYLRPEHELCYSFGRIVAENRKRVQNYLIRMFKPPANTQYWKSISFDKLLTDQLTLLLTYKPDIPNRIKNIANPRSITVK
jgi:hypothetical protein